MRRPRVDWEAVFWCGVAFVAYTIGLFVVLVLWRFVGGASEGPGYTVVSGVWSALCAGVAVALLVREYPARGLWQMVAAMYAIVAGIGVAIAAARLLAAPTVPESWGTALIYGASFGLLDIETLRPLVVLPPKDWFVVGAFAGYAVGRLVAGPRTIEPEHDGSWWLSGMVRRP